MKRRHVAWGLAAGFLLLLGYAGVRLGMSGEAEGAARRTDELAATRAGAAGVAARPHDPARAPVMWVDPDADRQAVEQALSARQAAWDLMVLDLDANAAMVPWLNSLITEDAFGDAIARCRLQHERQQPSLCRWRQDIVLRRRADGRAEVAAVRARVTPELVAPGDGVDEPSPACRAWAECVADAWRDRPGKFPEGADRYLHEAANGDAYLAITAPVNHLELHGVEAAAYRGRYEDALAAVENKIGLREQALAEAEDEGKRSRRALDGMYYSLLLERGWAADRRRYLEFLEENEP